MKVIRYLILISVFAIMGYASSAFAQAQQLAFPGAEGFGAYSKGGRGGDVYHVTNLNDDGAGSLRYGISSATGPRTIVFDVSGNIHLALKLKVEQPYITIAGQTAPGDGIAIQDQMVQLRAPHLIVRYIRCRLGDQGANADALQIIDGGVNVIVDHVSASWSLDEVLSCGTENPLVDSVTVQWCFITEALNVADHSYGSLIRGTQDGKYTYCKNLYAHNRSRNPRPGNYDSNPVSQDPEGLHLDFYNNVMYNWMGDRPGYDGDTRSTTHFNYINNYGKPGPDSDPTGYAYAPGSKHFRTYFAGNYFYGSIPGDPWTLVDFSGWSAQEIADYKLSSPIESGPQTTVLTAQQAYDDVLAYGGASFVRDAVDLRVIDDVINGTGSIIDSQDEVGGWPTLNSTPAPTDTDQDGMPDSWETARGLNPNDASDRNGDDDSDGYTNLEEYLNSLVGEAPVTYTLTVNNGSGDGNYPENQVVAIEADPAGQGFAFDQWTGDVANIADVNDPTTTITMPGEDATITATYITATTYLLTVNSGTGDGYYQESTVVDISADTPPTGYVFDQWVGDVANVADVYAANTQITMPAADATITATYLNNPEFSLLTPADGSTTNQYKPTFTWEASAGADDYTLIIDDNSDFSSPHVNATGITVETYTLISGEELVENTPYFWKVIAYTGGNPTECNSTFTFTTKRNLKKSVATLAETPMEFKLSQNYPNPFNPETTIKYSLEEFSDVNLTIINMQGQVIKTLVHGRQSPGHYKIQWNATNNFGDRLTSGLYIYKLDAWSQSKRFVAIRKMVLMK